MNFVLLFAPAQKCFSVLVDLVVLFAMTVTGGPRTGLASTPHTPRMQSIFGSAARRATAREQDPRWSAAPPTEKCIGPKNASN
jgi:hypothetical protein